MKKHKPTLKWCARQIRKWADSAERASNRRAWDSTMIASEKECLKRSIMLDSLASEIEKGNKQ